MKNILVPILLICLIIGFSACSNDEDEACGTAAVGSLENLYGCVNTAENMDFTFSSTFQIIRTQGSFDSLILGNCKPIIDFSIYDIIVGEETLSSGIETINYNYKLPCNGVDGILEVSFVRNATTLAPTLTYHALIPKLGSAENVSVDIQTD
jgi:hypothetical protein